jgi:hypothetical protein
MQNDTILALSLKLPLAGRRITSTAGYEFQNVYGFYWSSTPKNTYAHNITVSSSQVYPPNWHNR